MSAQAGIHTDSIEHAEHAAKTPGRHPDIQIVQPTPDRTNTQGARFWGQGTPRPSGPSITVSSPSPFAIRATPAWALDFDDSSILKPTFVPNPSLSLTFLNPTQTTNPTAQSSFPEFSIQPESPIAQQQLPNVARQSFITTSPVVEDPPNTPGTQLLRDPDFTDWAPFPSQDGASAMSNATLPEPQPNNYLAVRSGSYLDAVANTSHPNNNLAVPSADDIPQQSVSPGTLGTQPNSNILGSTIHRPASQATTPQLVDLASLHSLILRVLPPSTPASVFHHLRLPRDPQQVSPPQLQAGLSLRW